MKRVMFVGAGTSWLILAAACVGDNPENTPSSSSSGGASSSSSGDGSTGTSSGSSGGSSGASSGSSGASSSSGEPCQQTCKTDSVLLECTAAGRIERTCALGCSSVTNECNSFEPLGVVTGADLGSHQDELEITLPSGEAPSIVDTSTGAITHEGTPVRAANADANVAQTLSGVTFERRSGLAIFRARKWTLRNVFVQGDIPVAFVSTESVTLEGYLLAACGQVGGAPKPGNSPGNGGDPQTDQGYYAGGGGGGYGTVGALGGYAWGDDIDLARGTAGSVFLLTPDTLRGGGRGGGYGNVGLGGGAVMIMSGSSILVGNGTTLAVTPPGKPRLPAAPMGINVGGCGGGPGGQGGGAGGAIVLEAPVVAVQSNAGLAANGGAGGAAGEGSGSATGQDGALGISAAFHGVRAFGQTQAFYGNGGDGATGTTAAQPGEDTTAGEYTYGGGGGGGVGRVIIRTREGSITSVAGSILSPAPELQTIQLL